MLKSIQLLSWGLLVSATLLTAGLHAQCELTPLPATSYHVGACNGMTFQSITGSLLSITGNCGGYEFGAPLTGGDVITSVEDISFPNKVLVYPNPTVDGCFIEITGKANCGLALKTLLGSTVEVVITASYLDMSDFLPGLYLLEIRDAGNRLIHIEKIIKL